MYHVNSLLTMDASAVHQQLLLELLQLQHPKEVVVKASFRVVMRSVSHQI